MIIYEILYLSVGSLRCEGLWLFNFIRWKSYFIEVILHIKSTVILIILNLLFNIKLNKNTSEMFAIKIIKFIFICVCVTFTFNMFTIVYGSFHQEWFFFKESLKSILYLLYLFPIINQFEIKVDFCLKILFIIKLNKIKFLSLKSPLFQYCNQLCFCLSVFVEL